ncbi:glycosyltransferase family 4 protein [Oceanomicrobium pacificus]|uniref:Glycosyltransferase n=1 Tax=Oceanomicrobium pacificus TaxID=2692916 RepID=A0A6B0TMX9_9RHOB|nr:glycosyltransferase family 4 protein [Oceanomicrobium pacificus]MXU65950.1 glycosyltransferase [Oceanomicrobium pacificus]
MTEKLKIAHLSFSALPRTVGGLEIVVDSLIRSQQDAGHDVTLVTRWKQRQRSGDAGFGYDRLTLAPNPTLPAPPYRSVGMRSPVAAMVAWYQWRHRFDIWHVHWVYPTAWMAFPGLDLLGVPFVVTAHGADIQIDAESRYGFLQHATHERRVRALMPRLPALTAISPSISARYVVLGADPGSVHPIPNGVDTNRLSRPGSTKEEVRARLNVPRGVPMILSVGRNEPRKGFTYIPDTIAALNSLGRTVVWVVVGQQSEQLLPRAAEAGVGEQFRALPTIRNAQGREMRFPPDELVDLYAAADILAFPSMSEGMPLTIIEAMAAGTPVVGNDVPGIADMIEDGADGVLCEARNPGAMADAISGILGDTALAASLSSRGREKAQQFDWDAVSATYTDLYSRTIETWKARTS